MKKHILKIIFFFSITILLLGIYENVFSFKYAKCLDQYYELPEDKVDVLFIGSSHVYKNINPAILYEDYGIAAYNLGSASQPIWNSYYYMEEALKTQKPKLVVVECYKVSSRDDFADSAVTIKATTGMRFSKTFIEAVNASVEDPKDRINYYLGFPWYHSRYGEIKACDFTDNYGNPYYDRFLGYIPEQKHVQEELPDKIKEITTEKEISEKNTLYLKRMIELAEEKNVQLMFLITPFCVNAEKKQPFYNSLEKFAEENDVLLLNGNNYYDEIGLVGAEDFADGNHLFYSGVNKFTPYLGKYLKEHYDLPDRRGDSEYIHWQRNLEYMKTVFYKKLDNFEGGD